VSLDKDVLLSCPAEGYLHNHGHDRDRKKNEDHSRKDGTKNQGQDKQCYRDNGNRNPRKERFESPPKTLTRTNARWTCRKTGRNNDLQPACHRVNHYIYGEVATAGDIAEPAPLWKVSL
jgi:hypothetical protein